MREEVGWSPSYAVPVTRAGGSVVPLGALDELLVHVPTAVDEGAWGADRARSDRWLAPRLHWSLRLTRAEAGDKGVWQWLALRYTPYVEWRWGGDVEVAQVRWTGGVNKQALARLWWGAELFRNGPDYRPVERAFVRQDLTNSYLHRPVVRARALALAIVDTLAPEGREEEVAADEINDLARAMNLAMSGAPPELEIGPHLDDVARYFAWVDEAPTRAPLDSALPSGPPDRVLDPALLRRAHEVADRCTDFARVAAQARGARWVQRRAGTALVQEPHQG